MDSVTDYSEMTLSELIAEEKKVRSRKTITALFIGIVIGIAVWAATHSQLFLPMILLVWAYTIGSKYSQNLTSIQTEIVRRDTVS